MGDYRSEGGLVLKRVGQTTAAGLVCALLLAASLVISGCRVQGELTQQNVSSVKSVIFWMHFNK